ncbi:hypothetical protein AB0918_07110, partial [Streptomyces sp. NPDC006864]|uniref:hypothetical protein n=1 Tax=Streptomyces sp. NPDC006864 TaxID=3154780 RepID=UPI00345465C8
VFLLKNQFFVFCVDFEKYIFNKFAAPGLPVRARAARGRAAGGPPGAPGAPGPPLRRTRHR